MTLKGIRHQVNRYTERPFLQRPLSSRDQDVPNCEKTIICTHFKPRAEASLWFIMHASIKVTSPTFWLELVNANLFDKGSLNRVKSLARNPAYYILFRERHKRFLKTLIYGICKVQVRENCGHLLEW